MDIYYSYSSLTYAVVRKKIVLKVMKSNPSQLDCRDNCRYDDDDDDIDRSMGSPTVLRPFLMRLP